jgi:hypothetical protein
VDDDPGTAFLFTARVSSVSRYWVTIAKHRRLGAGFGTKAILACAVTMTKLTLSQLSSLLFRACDDLRGEGSKFFSCPSLSLSPQCRCVAS